MHIKGDLGIYIRCNEVAIHIYVYELMKCEMLSMVLLRRRASISCSITLISVISPDHSCRSTKSSKY